jgi:hypothetical protein
MSLKLKTTRNNPNPVEFKKEHKQQQEQLDDEIEILEETAIGQYNNNFEIKFKREQIDNNNEKIKQLELENKLLLSENNLLNKTIHAKSNEIIDLLKQQQQRNENNQLNEHINKLEFENKTLISKIIVLNEKIVEQSNEIVELRSELNTNETASNQDMSLSQLDTDSDQNDDQSEQSVLNSESESAHILSTDESDTESDQSDDETNNKVINFDI